MGWRFSVSLAFGMFAGGLINGLAGNIAAMIAAFCASAGWGVAAMEERRADALAQLREGKQ